MPIGLAVPILTLCLAGAAAAVWRLLYPLTDWAALALLLLAALVLAGNWHVGIALRRARLHAALRAGSPLGRWWTGRLRAGLTAVVFVLIFLPLCAAQLLAANAPELAIFAVLTFTTALLTCAARRLLLRHLHPPFATATAVTLASLICGAFFTPLMLYVTWALKSFPGDVRGAATIGEAALAGLQGLPPHGGWIAEVLAPLHALDAIKLWLATREAWAAWGTLVFAAESALFSFILARAAALLSVIVAIMAGETP
ncbi:hypothetical protein [Mameliella alba]|uniref:hypothetical protein n=1 Tax=Mameliella alba TaxID=561184 RepID=UPI0014302D55|nr:hypothetical protein [Mameliella alba]